MTEIERRNCKQQFIDHVQSDLPRGWPNGPIHGPHSVPLDRKDGICFEFFVYARNDTVGLQFYSELQYLPDTHPDRSKVVGPFLRSRVKPLMEKLGEMFCLCGQTSTGNAEGLFLKLELRNRPDGSLSDLDLGNLKTGLGALIPVWLKIRNPVDEAADWNRDHPKDLQNYLNRRCSF